MQEAERAELTHLEQSYSPSFAPAYSVMREAKWRDEFSAALNGHENLNAVEKAGDVDKRAVNVAPELMVGVEGSVAWSGGVDCVAGFSRHTIKTHAICVGLTRVVH